MSSDRGERNFTCRDAIRMCFCQERFLVVMKPNNWSNFESAVLLLIIGEDDDEDENVFLIQVVLVFPCY